MNNRYRLERWIVFLLIALFALPFVGEAEAFYAKRLERHRVTEPQALQAAPTHASMSLPEDTMENPIDAEPR